MGLLDDLMGGGERQNDYRDFVGRYQQGAPYDGISDDEAFNRHEEMASQVSPDDYQEASRQAFEQMGDEDRRQFGQELGQRAQEQNLDLPGLDRAGSGDPNVLAGLMGQMHGMNPGMLGQLMGGGMAGGSGLGGGGLGGGLGALGGMMGGGGVGGGLGGGSLGGGGLMGGPAGKAVLGGIAAMAAQRFLR